jgi:hypothetical protein
MGYTLKIGEAIIRYDSESVGIDCDIVRHDNAPAFGEPTDYENQRWPSYSSWAETMKALDLIDVMFNQANGGDGCFEHNGEERYPLIEQHPGAAPITIEHLEKVKKKVAAYKAKHPTHIAKYLPDGADGWDASIYDGVLCRAEWLIYWMEWALANCKMPVFVNS